MQFTVDVWREQVAQKVQDLKSWLDRRRREEVPYLLLMLIPARLEKAFPFSGSLSFRDGDA